MIFFYAFISFQYAFEKHHAGLKVLSSRLKKLENLNLDWNQCNDSILPSLTGFSSLKSLGLSHNQLTGLGGSFYGNLLII
jgi:hypothetical protein